MEIEALQLMAKVGPSFKQPVRPVGEIVHVAQWIEITNRDYDAQVRRQIREDRTSVNPRTHL